jgi:hypothetical protein
VETCANSSVTTQDSDDSSYDWKFGQANLIVEGVAGGRGVGTEGQEIVQGIVQNATSQ